MNYFGFGSIFPKYPDNPERNKEKGNFALAFSIARTE
jgi:hypothetical protein